MSSGTYKSALSHGYKYMQRWLGAHFPTVGLHAQYQVYLELSTRCNMKCSYCDLWGLDHSSEVDPVLWTRMLPELLDILGQPKVNFAGGEPLLCPVIFDLLQICVDRGAYPGFVTNGRLLNEKNVRRLAELDIANINISLDDDRSEVFDRVRRAPGHTELLLKNIALLQKALQEHHCYTVVCLKSVIHAENANRLVHMVELARSLQCLITFQPLSSPFGRPYQSDWYKSEPLWPVGDQLTTLHAQIDKLVAMKNENAPIGNALTEMEQWHEYFSDPEKFRKNGDDSPCLIGYNNLYIFSGGEVKYCPTRPVVGNIKTQGIREILMSEKSEKEIVSMRKCRGEACVKTCMTQKSLAEMIALFFKLAGKK